MSLEIYRKPEYHNNKNYNYIKWFNHMNKRLSLIERSVKDISDTLKADITETY